MTRAGKAGRTGLALMIAIASVAVMTPGMAVAQYPVAPPAAGPLRPFQLPALQESTLPNGLKLVVIENHKLPVVGISLSVPAGSKRELPGREGSASLMADLLTRGTTTRSADQIASQIEALGSTLAADADPDFLNVS